MKLFLFSCFFHGEKDVQFIRQLVKHFYKKWRFRTKKNKRNPPSIDPFSSNFGLFFLYFCLELLGRWVFVLEEEERSWCTHGKRRQDIIGSTNVCQFVTALHLSNTTVYRIFRKIFQYPSFKISPVLQLLPTDSPACLTIQLAACCDVNKEWLWNILLTDEMAWRTCKITKLCVKKKSSFDSGRSVALSESYGMIMIYILVYAGSVFLRAINTE